MKQAEESFLNELRPAEYDLYVTEGQVIWIFSSSSQLFSHKQLLASQPGFEVWAESPVAQPFWTDFRRAEIMLRTTELINHKMFFDRECNDLSPYTNCFAPFDVCYDRTGLQCNANAQYRTMGGTCNNLQNPKLGAQYSAYSRLLPAEYHDCEFDILRFWLKTLKTFPWIRPTFRATNCYW